MPHITPPIISQDPWERLREYTEARIALGRAGVSLPLHEHLQFKLSHAKAKDAVYQPVHKAKIASAVEQKGHNVLMLQSMAAARPEYLSRPDKGRLLDTLSQEILRKQQREFDLCLVICDGLSAPAVNESGAAVTVGLLDLLGKTTLTVSPVCLVTNGRVAIGDEIGSCLDAKMVVTLIGERPGLSSPNSLGAYLTYNPAPGTTDERRNCISNIRNGGITIAQAIQKTAYLIEKAFSLGETGVMLKDTMSDGYIPLLNFKPTEKKTMN